VGFRLDTPFGPVADRGTQFEARVHEGTLILRTREGSVTLRAAAGGLTVSAGERLEVGPGGRIDRSDEAPTSPEWAWAASIAPSMAIEGRSLREFLDWLVREHGGRLEFDDPALAGRAPGIVLRGTIEGMSLDEALRSVSATCGVTSRWEGDILVVRAANSLP
jgi:ferric-dicitrate binding protein FerR (iron transport regulator)